MLYAGLDLSRKRLDVCLLTEEGEIVGEFGVPTDRDGLRGLIKRVGAVAVLAVIESMTGARFVHDRLEQLGWDVRIADAQKVKGLAPFGVQDRPDRRPCPSRPGAPRIWFRRSGCRTRSTCVWAMLEATMHALRHEACSERYQQAKRRLGKQRGAKVVQIDIARRLTEAGWHMLTNQQPFSPKTTAAGRATFRLAA